MIFLFICVGSSYSSSEKKCWLGSERGIVAMSQLRNPGIGRLRHVLSGAAWWSFLARSGVRCGLWLRTASGLVSVSPVTDLRASGTCAELRDVLLDAAGKERPPRPLEGNRDLCGGAFFRSRVAAIADYCASHYSGDFVEIGCAHGETTKELAEVALRHGRRVLAVDPWYPKPDEDTSDAYEQFLSNIADCERVVDIVRLSSLDERAKEEMKRRELSFALVDGLHTYKALLSDLLSVGHCHGIIAADDLLCSYELMVALREAANRLGRPAVHQFPCREGYLFEERATRWP